MFDLSVIVPTHNRRSFLPALLESLAAQDYPADHWELVVVDDGSSDGTAEYLLSQETVRPHNMVVLSQPQSGVASARNNGAGAARGRAVLFLDDDMIASPSLVREHAQIHMQDTGAVVTGHVSLPTGEREPWVAWEDAQMGRHFAALKNGTRTPGPRDFYTGNCSVSADLFKQVGGFDTDLPRAEDVEVGYRLAAAGARFYYRSGADSLHLGRHAFPNWLRNAKLYGRCDVMLAWEKGHTHLQTEIFQWYRGRNAMNKALVQGCSALPALENPAVHSLHMIGYAAHKIRARRLSTVCYSAIYNLAYWLEVTHVLGKEQFQAGVKSATDEGMQLDLRVAPTGLKDGTVNL
jgi:glycosyltransferase involved in cell wall biosynthesis